MRRIVFMFSGQGAQYYQMGAELYARDPVYRASVDRCADLAGPVGGRLLSRIMFEHPMSESERFDALGETNLVLFAQGWAVAETLRSRGIRPDVLLGYSLGEFIAATVAGVLPLEVMIDLLKAEAGIVAAETPPASMLAVLAPPAALHRDPAFDGRCAVAAVNADTHFVVALADADVPAVTAALDRQGVSWARLPVRRGFHTGLVDGAGPGLRRLCFGLQWAPPSLPLYSCALADHVTRFDGEHLWTVVREPVRFRDTIARAAAQEPGALFIDCGPSGTLASLARLALGTGITALPAMNQFGRNLDTLNQIETALR